MRPTMTVAVASYQRREPILRLLQALAAQVHADPQLGEGLDVVVVLDGSSDGSREALDTLEFPVPLQVRWRENRGLAATRNDGWRAARSELVWFLDDDLVPGEGLLRRHRAAHAGQTRVVVGPCVVPAGTSTTSGTREWWNDRYSEMAQNGITRFDQFSAANTSLPRAVLEAMGGFDENFRGYGREDYELGLRLLDAAVPVIFDADAVAWHEQRRTEAEGCRLRRQEGRNVVRFARSHPSRRAEMLRAPAAMPVLRTVVRLLRPVLLLVIGLVARSGLGLVQTMESVGRRPVGGSEVAMLCFSLGVLEEDVEGIVSAALIQRTVVRARSFRIA